VDKAFGQAVTPWANVIQAVLDQMNDVKHPERGARFGTEMSFVPRTKGLQVGHYAAIWPSAPQKIMERFKVKDLDELYRSITVDEKDGNLLLRGTALDNLDEGISWISFELAAGLGPRGFDGTQTPEFFPTLDRLGVVTRTIMQKLQPGGDPGPDLGVSVDQPIRQYLNSLQDRRLYCLIDCGAVIRQLYSYLTDWFGYPKDLAAKQIAKLPQKMNEWYVSLTGTENTYLTQLGNAPEAWEKELNSRQFLLERLTEPTWTLETPLQRWGDDMYKTVGVIAMRAPKGVDLTAWMSPGAEGGHFKPQ